METTLARERTQAEVESARRSLRNAWAPFVAPEHLEWTTALLVGAYTSPERRYHDHRHVFTCLEALEGCPLGHRERMLARASLLWHDVVYAPRQTVLGGCESLSSGLLLFGLGRRVLTLTEQESAVVHEAVFATSGTTDPATFVARVVRDADWSILGAPPAAYDAYAADVREEFLLARYTEEQWTRGRRGFLAGVLERGLLFATPWGEEKWGPRARENVRRELEALEGA